MTDTLRLVYPEWQGGWPSNIAPCAENKLEAKEVQLGYNLGSQIVNLIVPPTNGPNDSTAEVKISTEYSESALAIKNHIYAYETIKNHIYAYECNGNTQ